MDNLLRKIVFIGVILSMSSEWAMANDDRTSLIGRAPAVVSAPQNKAIRHLSWPKIVRTENGTLILAYSAGIGHNKGASGLAVSLSEDGGRTFSAPELLCYYPKDDPRYRDVGNLALGMGEDGVALLLAMAFDTDKAHTILGWCSRDHGKTWQRTDTSAIASNRTGSVFGHVFAVPGKGLAVCGHYRPPTGEGIWIAYSRDNGQSWGPPQTITTRKYQEPVFIYTDGKLVGLVRENEACAYHQFVSRDLGATWHMTERAIQGHATAVHPSPFLAVDPGNAKRLYALVSERAPANRISLWETLGDTVSWRRLGLVAKEDGGWDWTYPWMTHLGGNAWYLVYYKGSKESASIHGARLEIPDPVSPGL